jgi:hypothetical protein
MLFFNKRKQGSLEKQAEAGKIQDDSEHVWCQQVRKYSKK